MSHEETVETLVGRFKGIVETELARSTISVAACALRIQESLREVGRSVVQAKADLDAATLKGTQVHCVCGCSSPRYVHTRQVNPTSIFGQISVAVRTFECHGCGSTLRPDDHRFGLPVTGRVLDDLASFATELLAELPARQTMDCLEMHFGAELSHLRTQGIIERAGPAIRAWREVREAEECVLVREAIGRGALDELRLEVAIDGVMAHIDGSWREVKVGTVLVRGPAEVTESDAVPLRAPVLARRYCAVVGPPPDLAEQLHAIIAEAGWQQVRVAQVIGDGAAWIWNMAAKAFPEARQVLDWYHLSQHLYEFANIRFDDPDKAKAWVQAKRDALREGRSGSVIGGLKRMRGRSKAETKALLALCRYVQGNRSRIDHSHSWRNGLAVGSGSVEGACKHLIQTRFKRAGMRWKMTGFLDVLEIRLAKLNGTLPLFWADQIKNLGRAA